MNKLATREAYGKALSELIIENEKVVVLDADLTKSTKTCEAKTICPDRHFNMGIAEGNMIGVAAGLACSGKVPYVSSFAMFLAGRAYEQIRNSIGYPHLNVKLCATHAGISVGEDGASHQSIEDLSLMRGIPGMYVFQPCDDIETNALIKSIANINAPCYVRLGRCAVESINDENYKFEIGKGVTLHKGKKVAIIATGLMVQEALKAAKELSDIDPTVVNIHTIKPIDRDLIIELSKTHEVIITCEEHNVIGGLGSAVAEVLSSYNGARQYMIGIEDTFGESGTPAELLNKYGLCSSNIVKKVREVI